MSKELAIIDKDKIIESFKAAPDDADMILMSYQPYVEDLGTLDKEFTAFADLKEIDEQACADAKALRLKYQKVRTGTENKRIEIKNTALLKCKAIDGAANIVKLKVTERENKLKEVETHFERIEEARKDNVEQERQKELAKKAKIRKKFTDYKESGGL